MNLASSCELLKHGVKLFTSKQHRPVTDAVLLAHFAKLRKGDVICDLCAGCGIVSALVYSSGVQPKAVYAVEIDSQGARLLEMLKNSNTLENFTPLHMDLRNLKDAVPANFFDNIIVNPPYFKEGAGLLPSGEIRTGARYEQSCTILDIAALARRHLRHRGKLTICHKPQRMAELIKTLGEHGIVTKRLRMVHKSPKTSPWLVLLEGQKGAAEGLEVLPPMFTTDGAGGQSEELLEIYGRYSADFYKCQ